MSGLALSGGSLLSVLQGKRVYQPIWQIIAIQNSIPGSTSSQLLVSDGEISRVIYIIHLTPSHISGKQLSYNVALHPACHITFDKSQWKNQNSGKCAEEVLTDTSSRYPLIKIIDYVVKKGDNTSVLFISKAKLMGFEKSNKGPGILKSRDVEVIINGSNVVTRSREGLEQFDVPGIEICEGDGADREVQSYCVEKEKQPIGLMDAVTAASGISSNVRKKEKKLCPTEFMEGDLAPLGPHGLNLLTLCEKCDYITYTSNKALSQFQPPARMLIKNMPYILPGVSNNYQTCNCDDENEQFRKEFQNKCMVVNQDSSGPDRKVQCILVSKDKEQILEETEMEMEKLKLANKLTNSDNDSEEAIQCIVPVRGKVARVSARLRLCEHCGVEERNMTACKHCAKVWCY